jgi:hypothetical protein
VPESHAAGDKRAEVDVKSTQLKKDSQKLWQQLILPIFCRDVDKHDDFWCPFVSAGGDAGADVGLRW